MAKPYRKKSFSDDNDLAIDLDKVAQQDGNGAFERMRKAPTSYNERMKQLYG